MAGWPKIETGFRRRGARGIAMAYKRPGSGLERPTWLQPDYFLLAGCQGVTRFIVTGYGENYGNTGNYVQVAPHSILFPLLFFFLLYD